MSRLASGRLLPPEEEEDDPPPPSSRLSPGPLPSKVAQSLVLPAAEHATEAVSHAESGQIREGPGGQLATPSQEPGATRAHQKTLAPAIHASIGRAEVLCEETRTNRSSSRRWDSSAEQTRAGACHYTPRPAPVSLVRVLPWLSLTALGPVACRARDHAPTPPADGAPVAAPAPAPKSAPAHTPSCLTRSATPSSAPAQSPTLELTVLLDSCRVVPVLSPHLTSLASLAPPGALAGVNGGYFDDRERPIGLRRIAGVDRSPAWDRPLGGVLALEGSRAYVGPRADLSFVPESAVQCQPLLVERDGQNGIHTDDGRRAARTTVCVTRQRQRAPLRPLRRAAGRRPHPRRGSRRAPRTARPRRLWLPRGAEPRRRPLDGRVARRRRLDAAARAHRRRALRRAEVKPVPGT